MIETSRPRASGGLHTAAARCADGGPPVRTVSTISEAPATHTVQRGEYLLRIASQYGMSLEDLRALNPGVGNGSRSGSGSA